MAIIQTSVRYAGDGANAVWPVPFPFGQDRDVACAMLSSDGRQKNLELGSDYIVSGQNVICVVPMGKAIVIWLDAILDEAISASAKRVLNAELATLATAGESQARETPQAAVVSAGIPKAAAMPVLENSDVSRATAQVSDVSRATAQIPDVSRATAQVSDVSRATAQNSDSAALAALESRLATLEAERTQALEAARAAAADAQIQKLQQTGADQAQELRNLADEIKQNINTVLEVGLKELAAGLDKSLEASLLSLGDKAGSLLKEMSEIAQSAAKSNESALENMRSLISKADKANEAALTSLRNLVEEASKTTESALDGIQAEARLIRAMSTDLQEAQESAASAIAEQARLSLEETARLSLDKAEQEAMRRMADQTQSSLNQIREAARQTGEAAASHAASLSAQAEDAAGRLDAITARTLKAAETQARLMSARADAAIRQLDATSSQSQNMAQTQAARVAAAASNVSDSAMAASASNHAYCEEAKKAAADSQAAGKMSQACAENAKGWAEASATSANQAHELTLKAWDAAMQASIAAQRPGLAAVSSMEELQTAISGVYIVNPNLSQTPGIFMGLWPVKSTNEITWDGIFFIGPPYPDNPTPPPCQIPEPETPPGPDDPEPPAPTPPNQAPNQWLPCGHSHE